MRTRPFRLIVAIIAVASLAGGAASQTKPAPKAAPKRAAAAPVVDGGEAEAERGAEQQHEDAGALADGVDVVGAHQSFHRG